MQMLKCTCATRGAVTRMFSIFSAAMYSPWLSLNMFFFRSMIFRAPLGRNSPVLACHVRSERKGCAARADVAAVEPALGVESLCSVFGILHVQYIRGFVH
jgi:hypothetical protein